MKALRQVTAIVRTELRFGLRRGWPVVGTAVIGLTVSAGTLYLAFLNMEGLPHRYTAESGAMALAMVWPAFQWLALGVLPMVSAPAIPSDRQFGVDELLRSLPLTASTYLAGKVLGTVAAVLLTGTAMLALHVILHLAFIGPLRADLYVELILLSALPLLIWAPAIGVLAACGLRTRRRAILVGMLLAVVGPPFWSLGLRPPAGRDSFFVEHTSLLSRQPISDFVLGRHGLLPGWVPQVTGGEVVRALAGALLVLLITSLLARLWLHWRENF